MLTIQFNSMKRLLRDTPPILNNLNARIERIIPMFYEDKVAIIKLRMDKPNQEFFSKM